MPKCFYCKKDTDKKNVIQYIDEFSSVQKKLNSCSYDCINKYKEEKEAKKVERDSYIFLCDYIMKLHNQSFLPNSFYVILGDLRNGTVRQKNILIKREKQGVSWDDLLYAYKYSEEKIRQVLSYKSFANFSNELNYCLAIVKNNIGKSKNNLINKKINENVESKVIIGESYNYIKKQDSDDISDILS